MVTVANTGNQTAEGIEMMILHQLDEIVVEYPVTHRRPWCLYRQAGGIIAVIKSCFVDPNPCAVPVRLTAENSKIAGCFLNCMILLRLRFHILSSAIHCQQLMALQMGLSS